MKSTQIMTLLCSMFMATWSAQLLVAGGYVGGCDDGSCVTCPQCNGCCELKSEKVDEDKHCWKVECKTICIPRIVFPWQKPGHGHGHGKGCCDSCTGGCDDSCRGDRCCNECCNHNGAKVRVVKVLKKHSYTCPACKYSWTPPEGCGDGCCDDGCCDACDGGVKWDEEDVKVEGEPAEIDPIESDKQAKFFRRQPTAQGASQGRLLGRRAPARAQRFVRPVRQPSPSKNVTAASYRSQSEKQPSRLRSLFK